MIEVTETWDVMDRWWTDAPERKHYAALHTDSVDYDVRACVCYDETTREWTLILEPTSKVEEKR